MLFIGLWFGIAPVIEKDSIVLRTRLKSEDLDGKFGLLEWIDPESAKSVHHLGEGVN